MSNNTSNQPIFRKKLQHGISIAVFEHSREGRTNRSINLQRSYKKDGNWNRMSLYLNHEDIPFIQEALKSVWEFMNSVPTSQPSTSQQPVEDAA